MKIDGEIQKGGTILWLRRDLRLRDHPAWHIALNHQEPVYPVFIYDSLIETTYGAAPKWRLEQSLHSLDIALRQNGSRLILRRGHPLEVLQTLINETGSVRVIWSRLYDPESRIRDDKVYAALYDQGVEASNVNASLLFEPWTVATQSDSFYRVYTPFWKAVSGRDVTSPLDAPSDLFPPNVWPKSDLLSDWKLGLPMNRGAAIVSRFAKVGEHAASQRLDQFIETSIYRYKSERDFPSKFATSGLSENLAYGEISPHVIWQAGFQATLKDGKKNREALHFLKELVWREFAYHLIYHTPHIVDQNWRPSWDNFPWREDNEDAEAWRRGLTGVEMVDAAMREMYVTGTMHNRTRMLVASYLTKHLMTGWRVGEAWFRDCLIDWDIAANAMGWQWTAGSGPDAAPYFRIYNPEIQAKKFDPDHSYRDRFIAEGRLIPHQDALIYFEAIPQSWNLSPDQPYPSPIVDLRVGRQQALEAYQEFNKRVRIDH